MFLNFMSEDVEVCVNLDYVTVIECVGDKLTLITGTGERVYEYVNAVYSTDQPRITYPDLAVEGMMIEQLK